MWLIREYTNCLKLFKWSWAQNSYPLPLCWGNSASLSSSSQRRGYRIWSVCRILKKNKSLTKLK